MCLKMFFGKFKPPQRMCLNISPPLCNTTEYCHPPPLEKVFPNSLPPFSTHIFHSKFSFPASGKAKKFSPRLTFWPPPCIDDAPKRFCRSPSRCVWKFSRPFGEVQTFVAPSEGVPPSQHAPLWKTKFLILRPLEYAPKNFIQNFCLRDFFSQLYAYRESLQAFWFIFGEDENF